MTKETLKRANEIDLEITAIRSLRVSLLRAKKVKLIIESFNDYNVHSCNENDEFYINNWMLKAMQQMAKEHEMELLQELDAL